MRRRIQSPERRRNRAPERGFTIIELAVVLLIVAILTSIAMANFIKFKSRASYTSCVSNQRHILEASTLYISATNPGNAALDVQVLTVGGYVSAKIAGCPSSQLHALDDYVVHVVNNDVSAIDCKIEPVEHLWNLP